MALYSSDLSLFYKQGSPFLEGKVLDGSANRIEANEIVDLFRGIVDEWAGFVVTLAANHGPTDDACDAASEITDEFLQKLIQSLVTSKESSAIAENDLHSMLQSIRGPISTENQVWMNHFDDSDDLSGTLQLDQEGAGEAEQSGDCEVLSRSEDDGAQFTGAVEDEQMSGAVEDEQPCRVEFKDFVIEEGNSAVVTYDEDDAPAIWMSMGNPLSDADDPSRISKLDQSDVEGWWSADGGTEEVLLVGGAGTGVRMQEVSQVGDHGSGEDEGRIVVGDDGGVTADAAAAVVYSSDQQSRGSEALLESTDILGLCDSDGKDKRVPVTLSQLRRNKCSICGDYGHNRRSCKPQPEESVEDRASKRLRVDEETSSSHGSGTGESRIHIRDNESVVADGAGPAVIPSSAALAARRLTIERARELLANSQERFESRMERVLHELKLENVVRLSCSCANCGQIGQAHEAVVAAAAMLRSGIGSISEWRVLHSAEFERRIWPAHAGDTRSMMEYASNSRRARFTFMHKLEKRGFRFSKGDGTGYPLSYFWSREYVEHARSKILVHRPPPRGGAADPGSAD